MTEKVLYIEDNPDNLLLVQRVLKARGYDVVWARNGQQGLELAEVINPGMILLDINLPDIDGYEVARRLRSHDTGLFMDVFIMAITANALKGDEEKALAAGCDDYLSKPFNIHDLGERVDSVLKRY